MDNVKDIVVFAILLGSNDPERNPKVHVPLCEYKDNLHKMVDYLIHIGISREKIIVLSPPPCDHTAWELHCTAYNKFFGLHNDVTKQYAAASCDAAIACSVTYIDLYNNLQDDTDWKEYLCDGLHFSSAGGKKVAELL